MPDYQGLNSIEFETLPTSATVSACARTLQKHGVASVDVLTLARVDRAFRREQE